MKIAFIGFGEAARAFRTSLAAREPALRFAAYDILLGSEGGEGACAEAMRDHGVEVALSPGAAIAGAEWVFSAVTADQSLAAVRSIAAAVKPGQMVFDINSVSPARKRQSAELLPRGAYIDMAVMAPVHPKGHATPVLLAGPIEDALLERLRQLGFDFDVAGPEVGAATAIKMVRSLFVKGLEAITVETLLAAQASGCLDTILSSMAKSYPGLGFPEIGSYQFERTLKHGRRRAAEMRESAATLDELGLHGALAAAVADVQDKMGAIGDAGVADRGLPNLIAQVLASRLNATSDYE